MCLKDCNIKIQNFTFSKSFKINQISLYILGRFLEPNVSISNSPRIFGHARAKWWLSGSHCQYTHRIQKYTRLSWDWNTCRNAWTNWTRNGDDNEVSSKEVDDTIVSISSVDGARSLWWLFVGMETAKHPKYWDIYNLNSGRIPFINSIARCSDNGRSRYVSKSWVCVCEASGFLPWIPNFQTLLEVLPRQKMYENVVASSIDRSPLISSGNGWLVFCWLVLYSKRSPLKKGLHHIVCPKQAETPSSKKSPAQNFTQQHG